MPLSWNEIRHNAVKFARDNKAATSESADKQTFWNEFFDVFGISRKLVASFEVPVLKASGNFGKIDLLWKRKLLVEHKSAGEDLGKAKTQAFDYIQAMAAEGREKEIPRYVIVSDFQRFVLYDLEPETQLELPAVHGRRYETTEFTLAELHRHIHAFAFIPGYKQHTFKEQDPINTGDMPTSDFPSTDDAMVPDGAAWWQIKICGEGDNNNQSTPFSNVISFGPVPAS